MAIKVVVRRDSAGHCRIRLPLPAAGAAVIQAIVCCGAMRL
jgi:hypothetical protein